VSRLRGVACAAFASSSVTRWYHCITRCVRRAFLLAEGPLDRREWIKLRLKELADIFAVAVGGFSVMDNHLHVVTILECLVRLGKGPGASTGETHRPGNGAGPRSRELAEVGP
jgi:hypothetical protein